MASKDFGYPLNEAWIDQLTDELVARQEVYDAEPDILLKRNKAANMLATILTSLGTLPGFKNDVALLPLKDLLIFLSDLDRGRDHPWSAPVNFGGTNITTTAQDELKIWVRAAEVLLIRNGYKKVEAWRHIAKGLTSSGRRGRAGAPVRWQRVQAWCSEPGTSVDRQVLRKVELWWFQQQAALDVHESELIRGRKLAAEFADAFWLMPHLRDLSVSPPSK